MAPSLYCIVLITGWDYSYLLYFCILPLPSILLRSSLFSGFLAWVGVLLGFRPICFFELAKPLLFPSFFRFFINYGTYGNDDQSSSPRGQL